MAMTLRLTEEEAAALRATAQHEHRSMHEVARTAIREYTSRRTTFRDQAIARILDEDADLLRRLGSA